jgi:hypothetical protein
MAGSRKPGQRPGPNNAAGGQGTPPVVAGPEKKGKDQTPPPAELPPANPEDTPAPDSGPLLTVRKIQDLIKENKFTPQLQKELGMNQEQFEQFAKKFEKSLRPKGPAREGREIRVSPNLPERPLDPKRRAPEPLRDTAVGDRNTRGGNVLPTDELHNLNEATRAAVPKTLQARVRAYTESLARSPVTAPARRPATAPAPREKTNP